MLEAPCPKDVARIDEEACDEYRNLLEDKAFVLEGKAIEAYKLAYDKGIASPVAFAWGMKAGQALNRMKPNDYPVVEPPMSSSGEGTADSFNETEKEGRAAIMANPKDVQAQYVMARVFYLQHKWEAARLVLEEVLKTKPDDAQVLLWLGHTSRRLGQSDLALSYYRKAADLKPDLVDATDNTVRELIQRGELVDAEKYLNQLLKRAPQSIFSQLHLGNLKLLQKKLSEARQAYERVLALDSQNALAQYNLGLLFLQGKEIESDDLKRSEYALSVFEKYNSLAKPQGDDAEKVQKIIKSLKQRIELEKSRRK
jgi:tetratricopeptide (TPR) repeat protein